MKYFYFLFKQGETSFPIFDSQTLIIIVLLKIINNSHTYKSQVVGTMLRVV